MTSVTSQAQQYSQRKLRKLSHCTKHDEPIINDLCCLRLIGLTVILSLELSFFYNYGILRKHDLLSVQCISSV